MMPTEHVDPEFLDLLENIAKNKTIEQGIRDGTIQPARLPHARNPPPGWDGTIDPSLLTLKDNSDYDLNGAIDNIASGNWGFLDWPNGTGNDHNTGPASNHRANSFGKSIHPTSYSLAMPSLDPTALGRALESLTSALIEEEGNIPLSDAITGLRSQSGDNPGFGAHGIPQTVVGSCKFADGWKLESSSQSKDAGAPKGPCKWNPARLAKFGGITDPRGPETFNKTLSENLGFAILMEDATAVEALMKQGARPMTYILGTSFAIDISIKLSTAELLRLFLADPENLAECGLRSLLVAVVEKQKEMAILVLDLGMREKLCEDEDMKLIVWGLACKYSNPDMLDTLRDHGPSFSWKAYWPWCFSLAGALDRQDNMKKIRKLKEAYMKGECDKRPLIHTGDIIDMRPEGMQVPKLADIMRSYIEDHQNVHIDDLYASELHCKRVYRAAPQWNPPRGKPWEMF